MAQRKSSLYVIENTNLRLVTSSYHFRKDQQYKQKNICCFRVVCLFVLMASACEFIKTTITIGKTVSISDDKSSHVNFTVKCIFILFCCVFLELYLPDLYTVLLLK